MKNGKIRKELLDLVDRVFAPAGLLVGMGGRHEAAQWQYAKDVALLLVDGGDGPGVGLMEAETGLGKSLGYLIPALAWLALRREHAKEAGRVMVSTYTRTLQRQLVAQDVPFALQVLAATGLTGSRVALRMGRPAFFSKRRVERLITDLHALHDQRDDKTVQRQWKRFGAFVGVACDTGSGMLQDWLDEFGDWPPGVSADDVMLLEGMEPDNDAYVRHLDEAANADLMITNHATTVLLARNASEGEASWDRIIIDEAHLLSVAAESMGHFRIQSRDLMRSGMLLDTDYRWLRSGKKVLAAAEGLEGLLKDLDPRNDNWRLAPTSASHPVVQYAHALHDALDGLGNKILAHRDGRPTDEDIEFANRLQAQVSGLAIWLKPTNFVEPLIQYSKSRRIPSLGVFQSNPGGVIRRLLKRNVRAIFTSATMASARIGERSYGELRRDLGLSKDMIRHEGHYAPLRFGKLDFVLMHPDVPAPVGDIDVQEDELTIVHHPRWVESVARMTSAAVASGPTLVLTLSYKEAALIAASLPESMPVVLHEAGEPMSEAVARFMGRKEGVLITPGAWEGLSLQGEGKRQVLKNLVIAHLPFNAADPIRIAMQTRLYVSQGRTAAEAVGRVYARQMTLTQHRLKQGIGRLIRGPHDVATVWMGDSRFPVAAGSARFAALRGAIPERFRAAYQAALLFEAPIKEKQRMIY